MAGFVKICGLSTPDALDAALDGGATHVGFIFFARSPRNVSATEAAKLAARAAGRAATVAVTVDAGDDALDALVATLRPGMLQLHGREAPDRVTALRRRFRLPVMKAVPVAETGDLAAVGRYRGVADLILIDAKPPPGAALPGGNGLAFDWSILQTMPRDVPFLLSGGINRGNLGEALAARPAGVDVSSGVESAPGVKDPEEIRRFLEMFRRLAGNAGSGKGVQAS
jgi:phosphoribosylanthranilate isomerase